MRERPSARMKWPDVVGLVISLVVLAATLYYGYVGALLRPSLGFGFDHVTGEVRWVGTNCPESPERCVRRGDRLVEIAGVPLSTYARARTMVLYDPLRELPGPIPVAIERDGRRLELKVTPQIRTYGTPLVNIAAIVIPLAFWLAGTLAVLFLRPRDERWLAFAAWSFLTALWFAAGFASETHLGFSSIVFHVAIWLWIAVMLHLHLILPERLLRTRTRTILLTLLYALVAAAIWLDLVQAIPNAAFAVPTLAAILVSFGLLLARLPRQTAPAPRRASRLMAFGVLVGCGPVVAFGLLPVIYSPIDWSPSLGAQTLIALLALIAMPLWPLAYLHALHRPDLRAFQFRGNRLLGTYGFLALIVFSYLTFLYAATVVFRSLGTGTSELERRLLTIAVLSSILVVAIAAPLRSAFQKFVDRRIFGIQYSPEQVVETMAAKLPGGFDGQRLQQILAEDLLPTMMIRQSALFLFEHGGLHSFLSLRLPDGWEPEGETLARLAEDAGRYLPRAEVEPEAGWVRLVLLLELRDETLGYWLFGSRDPDDFYSRTDIDLLRKLANQVAVVLKSQQEMAERRALQTHLQEVQKMDALGRLAAGVAHDFNNLLSIMLVAAEMAHAASEPEGEVRELLDEVTTACDRAAKLTKQLLIFSKRQTFDLRPVDLNVTIRENLPILGSIAGAAIDLDLDLEEDLPFVEADPTQLEQVLFNLAINAADAMPRGGTLRIETARATIRENQPEGPRTPPPGEYVRWTVADDGDGMEDDVVARAFEPFFTTKKARGGTGLGLSLVYGIVQQSGGHTFLASRPDEGARFDIFWPALEESESLGPLRGDASSPDAVHLPAKLQVLVAEDEANIRTLVSRMLRAWGCEVTEASNGVEALELFRRASPPVDLLLTDLVMPDMGGNELARAVGRENPDLPIIYMSGYVPEDTLGDEASEAVLLAKPFTAAQLRASLREVLSPGPPVDDLAS